MYIVVQYSSSSTKDQRKSIRCVFLFPCFLVCCVLVLGDHGVSVPCNLLLAV